MSYLGCIVAGVLWVPLVVPAHAQPVSSLRLLAPAPLSGTVRTAVGAAVPNARVTLFQPGLSYFAELRTDWLGRYRFRTTAPGALRLGVAAPGWEYQEVDVTVPASPGTIRDFSLAPESHPGSWDIIGTTSGTFFDASDIGMLLANGKVMYCHDTLTPVIFDPLTGVPTQAASSGLPQGCMNVTLLADARALFVGGQPGSDPGSFVNAVRYVKTYTPATNSWIRHADLLNPTGRWYPGMVRLADGSVMAMGGGTAPNAVRTATCERLSLATMTWSWTGSMLNPSEFTPSAMLYTGEVLITWSPPQLYNPATGQWRATGNFVQPARAWPDHSDHSLVMLADGRALAVGINRAGGPAYTTMSEFYTPATEAWSLGTSPGLLREKPEVVQMPDGRVLVAAGDTELSNPGVPNVRGVVKWTDVYDPANGVWRRVADMLRFREYHAVTLLVPDGRVLTTGGTVIDFQNPPISDEVEAFSPPYLFRGVRPQIVDLSSTDLTRGQTVQAEVFPATRVTSVVLMGAGATTHWVDAGVPRRLILPATQTGSTVSAAIPADPNVVPTGYYILFLMVDDIPSIGRMVRVP